MTFLVGGGFQDSEGNPASNGYLIARLSAPAVDISTGATVICTNEVKYKLDMVGNVSVTPVQSIWSCDQMEVLPSIAGYIELYYDLRTYTSRGQLVWGPNALVLSAATQFDFAISQDFTTVNITLYVLDQSPLPNSLFLYVNGLLETNYTLVGNLVTLGYTPSPGDVLSVVYYINPPDGTLLSPTFAAQDLTGIGAGNVFTLSQTPLPNTLALYRNGVFQTVGPDYTLTGATVTVATALGSDRLYAIYQTVANLSSSYQQALVGLINGSNLVFSLSLIALVGSLQFFWNGVYQTPGLDYTTDGATVTMVVAPQPGDTLEAYYCLSGQAIDLSTYAPTNPA